MLVQNQLSEECSGVSSIFEGLGIYVHSQTKNSKYLI